MNASVNTDARNLRCRELACLIGMALSLAACGGGGGGGNVKPSTTSGGSSSSSPTLPQPPVDAQLSITDTYAAHTQGYTGSGVTIGVVDSGIMRSNPTVAGRVQQELIYVDPTQNNTSIDDVVGHGTWVSEIAAGQPFGQFAGGIAPGAALVSARIISDNAPDDNGSTAPSTVTASDAQFFGQVNADLVSAGVKVMNNSWGGITWDTTNTSLNQAFDQAYSPFVNQHDGLVVFAAGNDSQANPSTIAMLPNVAPDLAKGWLVAVAVNSNNPTQLESYSNQCGAAMNYCLAAPGDVIVLDKNATASTTNPSYYIVEGTSFAAPEVSGAAALVWQAYPYFTNDLVRQTLLGTADPLGGSQPNPTYGYGELDVGRAVNGPMQFNWGDVTVSFVGNSSWNNPISGAGGLIKQGSGTLNLDNVETYTGLTQIQGGTLAVYQLGSPVQIGAQGTLVSAAASTNPVGITVNSDVTNAGVLVVNHINAMVTGNYVQQGNGRLAVPLGSQLYVQGTATLSGGDLYVYGANSGYTVNSHTSVLTANGGLTGTFSALDVAPGVALTATLNYDANSAWLNVQQVNLSQIQGLPYTVASYSAAQRVQQVFDLISSQLQGSGTGTPVGSSFVSGAANLQHAVSTEVMQQSLESLSGQLHAASAAMTFEAIDAGTRALANHFDQLLSAPPTQQLGAWVQNLGYQGSMSRSGYNNVAYDLNGWMVGQDFRVDGSGVAGFALSGTQGLGRLTESADQGYSRAVEGMLYGGTMRGNWYALGRFGFGDYQETMQRQVQLGGQATGAGSDSSGRYGVAYGESGYRMMLGDTRVMPYASLEYAQIQRDGFDEVGGDGFGLKADALTAARWQAGLGVRATRNWQLGRAGSLSLQGQLAWQQSFGLRGEVFDASFTGVNQWAPLGGIGLARYGGLAGATLNWTMNPRSSLALDYESYFGQGQEATMAMLNYRWSF